MAARGIIAAVAGATNRDSNDIDSIKAIRFERRSGCGYQLTKECTEMGHRIDSY